MEDSRGLSLVDDFCEVGLVGEIALDVVRAGEGVLGDVAVEDGDGFAGGVGEEGGCEMVADETTAAYDEDGVERHVYCEVRAMVICAYSSGLCEQLEGAGEEWVMTYHELYKICQWRRREAECTMRHVM